VRLGHDKYVVTLHSVEYSIRKGVSETAPYILLYESKEIWSLKNPINRSLDLSSESGAEPGLPCLVK
jgi:hypothetical protein